MADEGADVASLPFEKALADLEEIVSKLEKGNVPLELSMTLYERGDALRRHCDRLLEAAEKRVDKITAGADGAAAGTVPLDDE